MPRREQKPKTWELHDLDKKDSSDYEGIYFLDITKTRRIVYSVNLDRKARTRVHSLGLDSVSLSRGLIDRQIADLTFVPNREPAFLFEKPSCLMPYTETIRTALGLPQKEKIILELMLDYLESRS